jgi:chloramphenicol-sensitive protein RarD
MTYAHSSKPKSETVLGVLYATSAFLIWGLSPFYWKALGTVPALEIILHRIVWSFVFLVPLVILQRRWKEFLDAMTNRRILFILSSTGILVGCNWLLYIWAVNNDHLLQASLGYYINPLVNVVLGVIFLRERLRPPQILAVLLATAGVLYLTIYHGVFPWIAITLALTFGFYGLIRKVVPVSSIVGLTVETMLLSFPALIYLIYLDTKRMGSIFRVSPGMDLLLMGASLVTAVPLLFFTLGTRRILLSTVGLLQYIAPSGMFLLAVFVFNEPFSMAQVWTFVFIWTALVIYTADSIRYYRQNTQALS